MFKKNLLYNILLSVSQFLFPLVSFPYASRILGPEGIGSVTFVDSFTQYFLIFSALGIPLYGIREIAKSNNDESSRSAIFTELLTIHILSTLLYAIIYFLMALAIPALRSQLPLVGIGIIIMFSNIFSFEWYFQGLNEFKFIAVRTISVKVISIVLMFILLSKHLGTYIYYGVLASGYVLNAVANIFTIGFYKFKFSALGELKRHIRPLIVILSSTLAISIYTLMDNIFLGFMKGNTAVGYYSTALRIIKIPFTLISAISTITITQMSQAYKEADMSKMQLLINKSFTFLCVVGFPIAIGLIIISHFLISIFAGSQFLAAAPLISILAVNVVLVGLNNLFGIQILNSINKESLLLKAVVIGMLVSVSFNLVLIYFYSYFGAAITNVITEIIVTASTYILAVRNVKFKLDLKILYHSLFASLCFFIIQFLANRMALEYLVKNFLTIALCATFYIIYMFVIANNYYINNIKEILLSKLKFTH
ncbi:flippase [Mucilaginibacter aquatilis]|uniref:Oligosaccharide flippase family protein n=1 Tax=Mucilaginibacter aquatilis TaxID=1517760 RepID=A0A6I4IQ64_9SPHI|nr:flippase [Mucilaginibacter aquatilis]MVN91193.1 oligosaccharide flippase family protein [Mucilaginibacter aquatilis]